MKDMIPRHLWELKTHGDETYYSVLITYIAYCGIKNGVLKFHRTQYHMTGDKSPIFGEGISICYLPGYLPFWVPTVWGKDNTQFLTSPDVNISVMDSSQLSTHLLEKVISMRCTHNRYSSVEEIYRAWMDVDKPPPQVVDRQTRRKLHVHSSPAGNYWNVTVGCPDSASGIARLSRIDNYTLRCYSSPDRMSKSPFEPKPDVQTASSINDPREQKQLPQGLRSSCSFPSYSTRLSVRDGPDHFPWPTANKSFDTQEKVNPRTWLTRMDKTKAPSYHRHQDDSMPVGSNEKTRTAKS